MTSERAARLHAELFDGDLSTAEVAAILEVDDATVQRRLRDGSLPGYRLGRSWRITEAALRQYVRCLKGEVLDYTGPPFTNPYVYPPPGGSGTITVPPLPGMVVYTGGSAATTGARPPGGWSVGHTTPVEAAQVPRAPRKGHRRAALTWAEQHNRYLETCDTLHAAWRKMHGEGER